VGRPLDLLIIEDSETDAELIMLELRRDDYDVTAQRVDTAESLRASLESRRWDIVLCDHSLPSFDSAEALKIVRERSADLPFVILSGSIGEEAAVEALKAGARDVVLKTNLSRIGPVVERELQETENRRRHREAETALLGSEARKTAILDSALDAVVSIDHEGRIVDFNRAAETLFGYAAAAVRGRRMAELIVPPSLRNQHQEAFSRHLATGESTIIDTRLELTGMRSDGSEFPVELSVTRAELSGRPFFTGYLRDLTEAKLAEQERMRLEEQIQDTQKLDAIGGLAGGITHDFNNILAVVIGFAEILLRKLDETSPLRPYVEEIKGAGERAFSLTKQLLAFSRRQVLEPKVLDLNAVITDIEPMLRRVIDEDVELVTHLDSTLGRVKADRSQLEQVLLNLAVNARDAMPHGGTLTFESRNTEFDRDYVDRHDAVSIKEGRYALLSVTDTGVGMDAETQARIFEPFFTTKEVGQGTGLGLSTVYGIVKQSEGFVWVHSELQHGTTFNVYLPLVSAPLDAPELPDPTQEQTHGTETVVVVEDDEALLRLVRQMLEEDGYTVLPARSGAEAAKLCEQENNDIRLVISDIVMPGMSGLELARALLKRQPEMKLLLMSGYSQHRTTDAERRELGAGFIQKPFSWVTLSRKIRELLDSP
jgi:PAS domain S-box-containing protein